MGSFGEALSRLEVKVGILPPKKKVSALKVAQDIDLMNHKLRCLMSMGGYKMKPNAMSDEQIKAEGDTVTTEIMNFLLMLRCSDEVIVRHGLTKEYLAMVQKAREELTELVKARMSGMMEIVQKNIQKAGARAQAERDGTAPAQPMDSVTVFSDAEGEH